MFAAAQWLHATTGRIATCAHSWMQAVHWVSDLARKGRYVPTSKHSPKWGPTTVALAQEIAALKECRPGIDYLARKLKVSVRTVKYHLAMLREAGLLVYRSKGTRLRGEGNQASVFERVVPAAFDEELGIRTVGEGVQRRPVGASEEHRGLLGKLAKKAARKARRRPRRTPVSRTSRCTPMQVGTSGTSSAASTYSPPENKLASGASKFPTQKKSNRGPKKPKTLNKIGRRYQLARELIQLVPWLKGASIPRIAWIVRHAADAGWTALEVQAIAEQERPILAAQVRRPSGLLADRLGNLHLLFTTPERRKTAVLAWQESRAQEQARHADSAGYDDLGEGPKSPAARRAIDEAFAAIRGRLAAVDVPVDSSPLALEDLSRDEIVDMRAAALKNPDLIHSAIALIGERDARRLYTNRLVDQTLALEAIAARNATFTAAF
ncbi:helix-turn-helix domain-containing protein [Streptomyces sp. NBC_01483]|uniref:helix-turn-helix domain-containing protein n=1 Tax=Streptomyces sp. NBC_01483 TaxID=2903883 RepID=UPI002E2EB8A2|nr:helix-turn-helix domain-containing protein [Streptomyces sp. NBC_01483]